MTKANVETLFLIVESSMLLDRCEEVLRATGKTAEAGVLFKLQQDIGVAIDISVSNADITQPAPGPTSAALWKAFKEVTYDRISQELGAAKDALPDADKEKLCQFLKKLNMPPSATPPCFNMLGRK